MFVQRAPLWSEVPVLLLNQPINPVRVGKRPSKKLNLETCILTINKCGECAQVPYYRPAAVPYDRKWCENSSQSRRHPWGICEECQKTRYGIWNRTNWNFQRYRRFNKIGRNRDTQLTGGQHRDSHLHSIHKDSGYPLMSEQVLCENTLSYISVSTPLCYVCSMSKPEKDYCRLASRTVI